MYCWRFLEIGSNWASLYFYTILTFALFILLQFNCDSEVPAVGTGYTSILRLSETAHT